MTRIDAHAHLIADAYGAEIERRGLLAYPMPEATPEQLLATMDREGIDKAVVSPTAPGVWFGDVGLARELARLVNEATAGAVRAQPGRLAGLAFLPLPDVDSAISELDYALDVLELDGVALLSNIGGTYLGDPSMDAVFDELDRRRAYVFLHPIESATPSPSPDYPVWVQEFPFDTTRALVNLIYGGTLERCPNIRLQVAHLGGTIPFIAHRVAELAAREPARAAAAPAGALTYLRRLYYDTGLANNPIAMAAVRELAGIDRVVYGTDWPYAAPSEGDEPAALGLDPVERAAVEAANVAALVPRFG